MVTKSYLFIKAGFGRPINSKNDCLILSRSLYPRHSEQVSHYAIYYCTWFRLHVKGYIDKAAYGFHFKTRSTEDNYTLGSLTRFHSTLECVDKALMRGFLILSSPVVDNITKTCCCRAEQCSVVLCPSVCPSRVQF